MNRLKMWLTLCSETAGSDQVNSVLWLSHLMFKESKVENKSICAVVSLAFLWLASLSAGAARIKEAKETIATYPFSDPDPVTILARSGSWERNARLYPYQVRGKPSQKILDVIQTLEDSEDRVS